MQLRCNAAKMIPSLRIPGSSTRCDLTSVCRSCACKTPADGVTRFSLPRAINRSSLVLSSMHISRARQARQFTSGTATYVSSYSIITCTHTYTTCTRLHTPSTHTQYTHMHSTHTHTRSCTHICQHTTRFTELHNTEPLQTFLEVRMARFY